MPNCINALILKGPYYTALAKIRPMKRTIALLFFLPVFFSCQGQSNKIPETIPYTQKLEFGLKGPVKKVTSYTCKVTDGKIPADTTDYMGRTTMTFDHSGNVLTLERIWDLGTIGKSRFLSKFSGTGRAISLKQIARIEGKEAKEGNYSYLWSDNYNYMIVSGERNSDTNLITLDSNYRLIKNVFKKEGSVQSTEEWKTIYKDKKINEVETKISDYSKEGTEEFYQVQVVKVYDKYGNPTVIYGYLHRDRQAVKQVFYKKYEYYEK